MCPFGFYKLHLFRVNNFSCLYDVNEIRGMKSTAKLGGNRPKMRFVVIDGCYMSPFAPVDHNDKCLTKLNHRNMSPVFIL